jgi:uncharacterized protein
LAVNDHKYRIEVGYGLEGILPDGKVGDIGRAMVPYLRANDFSSAVSLAVDDVAQVIAADAKVTLNEQPVAAPPPVRAARHGQAFGRLILLIFLLVFFGGSGLFRLLAGLGILGGWGRGFWGGGGFGGFGGGGSGGGDSGGGFGGFGGDGGGFGGGGAGGDW